MRPRDQTLALSITAIVAVVGFRIVTGVQGWLLAAGHFSRDPWNANAWDGNIFFYLCWLMLASVFGGLYCLRATLAGLHSRPLTRRTRLLLGLTWVVVLMPVLAFIARFAGCIWLGWAVWLW